MVRNARASLAASGIDVDELIARIESLQNQLKAQSEALVEGLDGREVSLPGYALPLEFSGTAVTEFLLVPYVGACIHVPPPPPNQMVFVQLKQEFVVDDLYSPVWITGRMSVQQASRRLSYVDGESQVATGYTLEGITVEPYEQ